MAEVTIMVLKVDLGCEKCYRKIKNLLCKYYEIRDQDYNEKEDTVIIKVVCCNPERIRQNLISKGRKSIKSIEMRLPGKPKEAGQKPKSPPDEKPKPADPPKPKKPMEKPPPPAPATALLNVNPYIHGIPCYEPGYRGPYHHGYGMSYHPPSSYDEPLAGGGWPSSGCRCNRSYRCRCEFFTEETTPCTIL